MSYAMKDVLQLCYVIFEVQSYIAVHIFTFCPDVFHFKTVHSTVEYLLTCVYRASNRYSRFEKLALDSYLSQATLFPLSHPK